MEIDIAKYTIFGIPNFILLAIVIIIALGFFIKRAKFLYLLVVSGQKDERFDKKNERIKNLFTTVLSQRCVLKDVGPKDLAGLGHAFMFYGFLCFLFSYIFLFGRGFAGDFSFAILGKTFALSFSFILDLAGIFVMTGIIWAIIRRYIVQPPRLDKSLEAGLILSWVFSLMLFNFIMQGFEINVIKEDIYSTAFISNAFASFFNNNFTIETQEHLFVASWWIHVLLVLGFLVFIPHSKHLHLLLSPFNIYFKSLKPKGAITPILNMEEAETFGVTKIEEYPWKQLLDLYCCTECGRCEVNCPAHLSEKPLSPKKVIHDLKEHLLEKGNHLIGKKNGDKEEEEDSGPNLIGEETISDDVIWSCVTCRSCMEQCPVSIEHIDKLIDLRRYLVLMESKFPQEVQVVFRNMENNSNPWGIGWGTRADWAKDLGVKILSEDKNVDILYWVGCAGSFDERNKKISTSFVKILQKAGVNFGILGTEEKCCGDSARRIGNEYLFQMLAMENIEIFKNYNVKKIVAQCPHGYNTLKNEYSQFGGDFEVVHSTEFLLSLIKEGKLTLKNQIDKSITFHDSCYLGRYNELYEGPREILKNIPGINLCEMERNKTKSICCGAGGGRMWMEEHIGKRINEMRFDDALSLNPNLISTACPFCLTMFEDAAKEKGKEESIMVKDIIELVEEAIV
jgi:Fe-S oxidoreductase